MCQYLFVGVNYYYKYGMRKELYFYGKLYCNCYLGPNIEAIPAENTWFSWGRFKKNNPYWKFLERESRNVVLYPRVGEIPYFDDANLIDDKKWIRKLNKKGLHIYLWEPLTLYCVEDHLGEQPESGTAYEFNKVFKYWNWIPISGSGKVISSDSLSRDIQYRAFELDSIEKFANANGLDNITVHCIETNTDPYFKDVYKCLRTQYGVIGRNYTVPEGYNPDDNNVELTKKFWCGNWRYAAHRHIMASYLINQYSFDDMNISWVRPSSSELLKESLYHTHEKFNEYWPAIEKGAERLKELTPINMDIRIDTPLPIGSLKYIVHPHESNPADFCREAFVSIITETKYAQPFASVTEKSVWPFMNERPFICVAGPRHLELLRSYGFKTFSDFWDEGYDTIECPYERMKQIFKLIDWIGAKSLEELTELHQEMKPILEHNRDLIIEYDRLHKEEKRL